MTVFTEGRHPGEALLSEGPGSISRAALTIAAEQVIGANMLLAKLAVAAGVDVSQAFEGTGNGVLTVADPAVNSKVQDGDYTITCFEAASDAGKFRVEDPQGRHVGDATVGVAFNKEIKFTIADGATDFVVGDRFILSVAANSDDFQYVAFDPTGADGSEIPSAMALYPVETGAGETAQIAGIVRMATINGNTLAWPEGITAAQKSNAIQALESRNIILRF